MTKEQFLSFYKGQNEKAASDCYDAINNALTLEGINTNLTLIGALATCRTEVGRSFLPVTENALFALRYEFRKDLGNTKAGDGVKYRGRGFIQLTGKNNYQEYGVKLGLDLISNPELAVNPTVASRILSQYFKDRAVNVACEGKNWAMVRYLVNGGYNGLTTFLSVINQYLNKTMETIKIIYSFKPVDKTYVIYQGYQDGVLSSAGVWESEADLNTNDEILAFVKTKVDASVEVELTIK